MCTHSNTSIVSFSEWADTTAMPMRIPILWTMFENIINKYIN